MQTQPQLLATAEERSPLEYFHGLYLVDAAGYGGASAFSWFADDAEALAYLRDHLIHLYLDAGEEAGDARAVCHAIGIALHGVDSLQAIDLDAVNAALAGLCQLRWAGSLDDLRVGDKPFELDIQYDFRQNVFNDERGWAESEWDDFAQHLTHYNG